MIIQTELISKYFDNPLAGHFGIKKTQEMITQKCYWLMLRVNIKSYIKGCNVCLASETVRYKSYGDL